MTNQNFVWEALSPWIKNDLFNVAQERLYNYQANKFMKIDDKGLHFTSKFI